MQTTLAYTGREIGEPASWILGLVAVSVALAGVPGVLDPGFYKSPGFAAILVAFVLHELAHRQVSRRYGLRSEFIAYTPGLLITLLSGLIPGIVIIAPGYVKTLLYAYTPNVKKAVYRSVAAGPLTNIVLSILALAISHVAPPGNTWTSRFLGASVEVNAWIAFFNLLPVPPLDGSKILATDRRGWAVLAVISIILLVVSLA